MRGYRGCVNPLVVVSSLALALSIISLGWQVWTWQLSGAVVRVELSHAYPTYDDGHIGDHHLAVTANNAGRSSVQVTGWGLQGRDGKTRLISPRPSPLSKPLPHTLEQGTSATWLVLADEIRRTSVAEGIRPKDLRAYVQLGNGKIARARTVGVDLG
jgi:hypothetical protein